MFSKLNLLYENWYIHGFLPNCLDENVLKFIIYQYPKIRHESDSIPYAGEKTIGPRFNMWTNSLGFTFAKVHFNPINFKDARRINNWIYPIEPWGHLRHSIDFDLHKGYLKKNFFQYIHDDVIYDVNNGKGKILVNYAHEGWVSNYLLRTFYEGIKAKNIKGKGVILLLNDIALNEKLEKFFQNNPDINREDFPILINYCYYVVQSGSFFKYTPSMQINIDEFLLEKKYKFLSLNRRLNLHRFILLTELYETIKGESAISFDKNLIINDLSEILDGTYPWPDYFTDNDKTLFYNVKEKLDALPENSFIDTDDLKETNGYRDHSSQPFKDSCVSIITETSFFQENDFISEKTWKPIWHFQPFIIVGRPYTLRYLKKLGFKTFDWLFDESYDNIEDDADRLRFIINEIKRVNQLSFEELKNLILSNKESLQFNHNLLGSYGLNGLYFEKKLIDICNSDLKFDYYDLITETKIDTNEKII